MKYQQEQRKWEGDKSSEWITKSVKIPDVAEKFNNIDLIWKTKWERRMAEKNGEKYFGKKYLNYFRASRWIYNE